MSLLNSSMLAAHEGELFFKNQLGRLERKKMEWGEFLKRVKNLFQYSHLTSPTGQTLFHLAVRDNCLQAIETLSSDPSLKLKKDNFGLSPVDVAQLLGRKEALKVLQNPSCENLSKYAEIVPENFEYLSHPIYESSKGMEKVLSQVGKAKKGDKIPAEKIWMGIYFDKEIHLGLHQPIKVKYINSDLGYGVFSEKKSLHALMSQNIQG